MEVGLLSEFGGKVIVLVVFVDCGMMIISLLVENWEECNGLKVCGAWW